MNTIDKFHFLLRCPKFQQQQHAFISKLSEICDIRNNSDNPMIKIMHFGHGDIEVASLVADYVANCLPNAWGHLCPSHHYHVILYLCAWCCALSLVHFVIYRVSVYIQVAYVPHGSSNEVFCFVRSTHQSFGLWLVEVWWLLGWYFCPC